MGFPSGYAEILLPKLLLHLLSLLGLIRALILTVLRLLGLSDFLEPEMTWPDPIHSTRPGSVSASALIREMLPVVKFSEVVSGADETPPERCAVCLYDFEGEEEIRRLRNCRHIFHRACLDRWMDHEQSTCPLCRASFVPEEMQRDFNERLWADVR
ncbi:hypothetical protein V2J09_020225 [Rumex salicifolius]